MQVVICKSQISKAEAYCEQKEELKRSLPHDWAGGDWRRRTA